MRRAAAGVVGVALAAALAACAGPSAPTPEATTTPSPDGPAPVVVFAASSLREAFPALADATAGLAEQFTFDGSASLLDQLSAGAPADVLATADEASMAKAVDAGLIVGTTTEFATNTLVVVVPAGNPADVTGFDSSLDAATLVICDPTVPCGAATARLADMAGLTLHPASQETSVGTVLGRVTSGDADAGIVYRTDALAAGNAVEQIEIPGAGQAANHYVVAATSTNPAAAAFIDAVVTHPEILTGYGFTTP